MPRHATSRLASLVRRSSAPPSLNILTLCGQSTRKWGTVHRQVLSDGVAHSVLALDTGAAHVFAEAKQWAGQVRCSIT